MLRHIKAIYATRTVHERNESGTRSELEPRSHVENFEKRLVRQGLESELLEVEWMGVATVLYMLDRDPQCVLMEDVEPESSASEDEVDMAHYHHEKCPFMQARKKTSGLCLLCVKQGKLCSKPTSFCVEGIDVSEQTLNALSLKEQRSRPFPHLDLVGQFEALKLKRREESHETHNCMSPSRLEHQESKDSHR